ncbi:hypothetical protein EC973_006488, partial [Apophysomyces ossiformis]
MIQISQAETEDMVMSNADTSSEDTVNAQELEQMLKNRKKTASTRLIVILADETA